MKPKPLSWFLDRIGKRIYRDNTCPCHHCMKVGIEGAFIADEATAKNMHMHEVDYFFDSTHLNYRNKKDKRKKEIKYIKRNFGDVIKELSKE